MITNFHTHTYRCKHASGTEEDYTAEAVRQGAAILGFSDHGPFPDKDYGLRMDYSELGNYINAINESQEKHKDEILLYKGLEIEYHPQYTEYYRSLTEQHGLDYLALGEHTYTTPDGEFHNIFFAQSTTDYIDYANAICRAIETGFFAFVAHPDVMFINTFEWDDCCDKASELIIDCAEKHNAVLEYNANGIRRNLRAYSDGIRYPYPHKKFWDMVKQTNIRVLVGSDCHCPEQIHDEYMRKAVQTAVQMGLNVIENIF